MKRLETNEGCQHGKPGGMDCRLADVHALMEGEEAEGCGREERGPQHHVVHVPWRIKVTRVAQGVVLPLMDLVEP